MIERFLLKKLENSVNHFPVTVILGPRQVGKTTLSKQVIPLLQKDTICLDLEQKASANFLL